MQVFPIAILQDNYAYACVQGQTCWIVDPGQAEPIEAWLAENKYQVEGFLITHHHADHTGGLAQLRKGQRVIGGDRFDFEHEHVGHGQVFKILDGIEVTAIHLPGHTMGAIGFHMDGVLFTGDVLFGAGCGRVFEGSIEDMYLSLGRIKALSPDTTLYYGHEYTKQNLMFAKHVEPDNAQIDARIAKLTNASVSVPGQLLEELQTNPFLRTDQATVRKAVEQYVGHGDFDEAGCLGHLRAWKSAFDEGER